MGIFMGMIRTESLTITPHMLASIGEVVLLTEANRNTVKKHLEMLVNKKLLLKLGFGKGTWYMFS